MWVSWQDFGKCFKMRHAHRARRPNALLRGDFNCKFLNKLQKIFGDGTGNVLQFGTRVAFCNTPHTYSRSPSSIPWNALGVPTLVPGFAAQGGYYHGRDDGSGLSFDQEPGSSTGSGDGLSTDPTITGDDTEVGSRPVRGLSTPGTSFRLIRLRAPTTRGTYYYGACVPPVDGEVETGNNGSPAVELVVR